MPLKSSTDRELRKTIADTWEIDWYQVVGHRKVIIHIRAGKMAADPEKTLWYEVGQWALVDKDLTEAMTTAGRKVKAKMDGGMAAGQAYYEATKEALYEVAQARGWLPSGSGISLV